MKQSITGGKRLNLSVWGKLLPTIRPHFFILLITIFLNLLLAGVDIILPLFQRYAVDYFIISRTLDGLEWFALVYGVTILLQGITVVVFVRLSTHVEVNLGQSLRQQVFRHLQEISLTYYNDHAVGYLLARVMNDTNRIASIISRSVVDLFWSATYVVGVLGVMLALNVRLAIMVIAIVPVVLLVTALFQGKILRANRIVRNLNSQITGSFNEGICGIKTSKSLVIEEGNGEQFDRLANQMCHSSIRSVRLSAIFTPIIMLIGSLSTAIVLANGGSLVMAQLMEIGTLSVFIAYASGMLDPVQQIADIIAELVAIQVDVERVTALLEVPCEVADTPEVIARYGDSFTPLRQNWEPIQGDVEFRDLTFRYPGTQNNVLEHLNLKIPAGSTVAIVGKTGAGKSTIVNLICRFFEPTQGEVWIDGRDYRERSQLWLRSNIGYVLQEPHLFSGTLLDNIRFGNPTLSDDEAKHAAQMACLDRVVANLEEGYATNVGENGDRLSAGEKQLVSIARALAANPPIFILDEATSSIDSETEALIQSVIATALKGRTSFVIAHRLSTIRHSDVILVVENGSVVESGNHEQLLELGGVYAAMCKA